MTPSILIIEDEAALATTLKDRLKKEGYAVTVARDGLQGLEKATHEPFDLILLDVMLPGQSGLKVCEKLRQDGWGMPILMLTARRQVLDKVVGFKTGADDYLTKPFKMAELLARVEALLRRAGQPSAPAAGRYQFDGFSVDFRRAEVSREGQPINLSAMEFQLLRYFVELLREVWGYDALPSTRTVDVHIAWLRQKIEKDPKNPQLILTIVGLGYKFAG